MSHATPLKVANIPLVTFPANCGHLAVDIYSAHVILKPGSGSEIVAKKSEGANFRVPRGQTWIIEFAEAFYAIAGGCNSYDQCQPHCYIEGDVLVVPQHPRTEAVRLPAPVVRDELIVEVPAAFDGQLRIDVHAFGIVEVLPGINGTLTLNADNGGKVLIDAYGPFGWCPDKGCPVPGPVKHFAGEGVFYATDGHYTADGYEFKWISPFNGWYSSMSRPAE